MIFLASAVMAVPRNGFRLLSSGENWRAAKFCERQKLATQGISSKTHQVSGDIRTAFPGSFSIFR
jgi:hypothetical protein